MREESWFDSRQTYEAFHLQNLHNCSQHQPASYKKCNGRYFQGCKVNGVSTWSLSFIWYRFSEWVEKYPLFLYAFKACKRKTLPVICRLYALSRYLLRVFSIAPSLIQSSQQYSVTNCTPLKNGPFSQSMTTHLTKVFPDVSNFSYWNIPQSSSASTQNWLHFFHLGCTSSKSKLGFKHILAVKFSETAHMKVVMLLDCVNIQL